MKSISKKGAQIPPSAPSTPTPAKENGGKQQAVVKGKVSQIGKKTETRAVSCWCKSKDAKQVERSVITPGGMGKGKGPGKNFGNLTGPVNYGHGAENKDFAKQ